MKNAYTKPITPYPNRRASLWSAVLSREGPAQDRTWENGSACNQNDETGQQQPRGTLRISLVPITASDQQSVSEAGNQ